MHVLDCRYCSMHMAHDQHSGARRFCTCTLCHKTLNVYLSERTFDVRRAERVLFTAENTNSNPVRIFWFVVGKCIQPATGVLFWSASCGRCTCSCSKRREMCRLFTCCSCSCTLLIRVFPVVLKYERIHVFSSYLSPRGRAGWRRREELSVLFFTKTFVYAFSFVLVVIDGSSAGLLRTYCKGRARVAVTNR
ncbi:unnamed protein product [Ectocarpus sp. 13 AM-2016]